jgi:exosome complex component RRP42
VVSQQNVFIVFVDLHIINDHGNLIDASALAAIAALKNARIPKVENGKIVREEFTGNLPVIFTPVVVSVCKVGNNFLIDPDLLEENVLDSRLVVGVRDDDKICAIQKQGSKPLKFSDVEKMLDIAIAKSKELRRLVG